jgi:hypothetical protein
MFNKKEWNRQYMIEYCKINKKEISIKNKIRSAIPENKQKRKEYVEKNKEKFKEVNKIWQKTINGAYSIYRSSAKRRNILFELTVEQFSEYWKKDCYYCGDKIETIGLDRVDNDKGYTIDNIVSCCEFCNKAKLKMSKEEFIELCYKIYKNCIHEVIEYAI